MKRFNPLLIWLWGAYTVPIVFKSFVGWDVPRELLVLQGVLEACFVLGGFYVLVLRKLLGRDEFQISRKHTTALFILLFVWTWLLIVSFALGIYTDLSMGYLVGDLFNYLKLPLILALAYFAIRDTHDIEVYIKGVIVLFGFFLAVDMVVNSASVVTGARVSTFTLTNSGIMVVVQLFVLFHMRDLVWRAVFYVILGLSFLGMVISQSRTSVFILGLGIVLMPFLGQIKLSKGFRRLMAALFVGAFCLCILAPVAIKHFHRFYDRFALIGMTAESRGVIGLGQRLPQTIGIFKAFSEKPENIFLGFGLGSSLDARMKIKKMIFSSNEHNPHAGVLLILFRLGIAGLGIAIFYMVYFFRKAMFYRRVAWLGGLLALLLIIEVLGGGVLYSNPLIHTLCGGFLAAEREMANAI